MNVIILAHDDASHLLPSEPGAVVVVGADVLAGLRSLIRIPGGTWTIRRTDRWAHDARVVDALRRLAEQADIEMIDPTGLLGGSTHPDLHPVERPHTGHSLHSRRKRA